jgi:hypothetical protein
VEYKAHSIPDPPPLRVGLQQFTLAAYREERESGAFPFLAPDCSDLEKHVTKIAMNTTNAANCSVDAANECSDVEKHVTKTAMDTTKAANCSVISTNECSDVEKHVTKTAMDTTNAANCSVDAANECSRIENASAKRLMGGCVDQFAD